MLNLLLGPLVTVFYLKYCDFMLEPSEAKLRSVLKNVLLMEFGRIWMSTSLSAES